MNILRQQLSCNRDVLRVTIWINHCLEGLWILAILLVPIAFLDRDYVVSEAAISYIEVPKIALLKLIGGLTLSL